MKADGIPNQVWFHYHPGDPNDPDYNPDVPQDSLWPEPFRSLEDAKVALDPNEGWIIIGPYELKR